VIEIFDVGADEKERDVRRTEFGYGAVPYKNLSIEAIIVDVMIKQKCTVKDAVKYIASDNAYGFNKNEVYAASLNVKKMFIHD